MRKWGQMSEINLENERKSILCEIGDKICLKRKKRRKKFKSISKTLNISANHLSLIEDGDTQKFPKHVPVMGFIRAYAKFLEVDIDNELDRIEMLDSNAKNSKDSMKGKANFPKKFIYFLISFALIIITLFFFDL